MRTPKRTIGYARVSSAEQALGTSLQDQQEVIRTYAAKRGLKVDRIYVEAESAIHEKAERREQVQALLRDARPGDLVLVDKIDRWSRDPEFSYRTVRELLALGAKWYAITEDCDPSTPNGDFAFGMWVLMAREEHKRIKVRMVGTRKLLRDRGFYVEGTPPLGYRRQDVKGLERNMLVVKEDEAAVVRDMFARCIGGESIHSIARSLDRHYSLVCDTLQKRIYTGEVKNSAGEWIKGQHPAIIEPHTFASARAAIDRRRLGERPSRAGSNTTEWWLRDAARCALCKGKLSAAWSQPYAKERAWFRCFNRCTPNFIPVVAAERACDPIVVARLEALRDDLTRTQRRAAAPRAPVDLEARRAKLDAKRARLVDGFASGDISRDELRAATAKLDAERDKLAALAHEPPPVTKEDRRALLLRVDAIATAWSAMLPTEKRVAINTLARAVYLVADREFGLDAFGRRQKLAVVREPVIDWYTAEDLARGVD